MIISLKESVKELEEKLQSAISAKEAVERALDEAKAEITWLKERYQGLSESATAILGQALGVRIGSGLSNVVRPGGEGLVTRSQGFVLSLDEDDEEVEEVEGMGKEEGKKEG